MERQVELEGLVGQVADSGAAVTVHGNFSVAPVKDSRGVWQRLYVLDDEDDEDLLFISHVSYVYVILVG